MSSGRQTEVLNLCDKCGRRGRYRLDRLIEGSTRSCLTRTRSQSIARASGRGTSTTSAGRGTGPGEGGVTWEGAGCALFRRTIKQHACGDTVSRLSRISGRKVASRSQVVAKPTCPPTPRRLACHGLILSIEKVSGLRVVATGSVRMRSHALRPSTRRIADSLRLARENIFGERCLGPTIGKVLNRAWRAGFSGPKRAT
jgi:hypothetical protein